MLLTIPSVQAQENLEGGVQLYIDRGNSFFERNNFFQAVKEYEKARKVDNKNTELVFKIVDCYWELEDYSKVEEWLRIGVQESPNPDPIYYKELAEALKINEKYSESIEWFKKYEKVAVNNQSVERQIQTLANIDYYLRDTSKYEISIAEFSTKGAEYCPTFLGDDIVYVARKHSHSSDPTKQKMYDIYHVVKKDSLYGHSSLFMPKKKWNSHEGPLVFFNDGQNCLITRSNNYENKPDDPDNHTLKIYIGSIAPDHTWHFDTLHLVPEGYSAVHPALTSDGKTLYFSAKLPDAIGKSDLYVSRFVNERWTTPENLGPEINTEEDEQFPYVYNDSVLYFASSGLPGVGGLDIFSAEVKKGKIGLPVNLGRPINSSSDDFGVLVDSTGIAGFFSSNRPGGRGKDDIYRFIQKRSQKIILEGFTKDRSRGMRRIEGVVMYDQVTNERIAESDRTGYFRAALDNQREYKIGAEVRNRSGAIKIHFEGFLRDKKDTTGILNFLVYDARTHEEVAQKFEGGFFTFFLHEGREYRIKAVIPSAEGLSMDDVSVEGFVMEEVPQHYNLGEIEILDARSDDVLFSSDHAGFFSFSMEKGRYYSIRTFRKDKNELVELVFEGFLKNNSNEPHPVELEIIDLKTDSPLAKSKEGGYMKFVLDKNRDYEFQATLMDGSPAELSDVRLEGFVKDLDIPTIAGEVRLKEGPSQEVLSRSDVNGFFSFPMVPGKKYALHASPVSNSHHMRIWFEGRMRSPKDSTAKMNLQIVDVETQDTLFKGNEGMFGFELTENLPYRLVSEIIGELPIDTLEVTIADLIKVEGFALNAKKQTRARRIQVFDAETDELLFETDEIGFYSFNLDPGRKYKLVAKREGENVVNNHLLLKFTGFIRDQNDSMTYAKMNLSDPVSKEKLLSKKFEGYYAFELEENKVYDFSVMPTPIKKDVLNNVNLVVVKADNMLKQFILEARDEEKLYEVNFKEDKALYTDGIIIREFNRPYKGQRTEELVTEFLKSEKVLVKDKTLIQSINYDYNKYNLSKTAKQRLDVLVTLLNKYPSMMLVISSFADSRGTADYNKKLTDKRNKSVINYLQQSGVNENRVKAISYGKMKSLECENCSENDFERNRRTDFFIISF